MAEWPFRSVGGGGGGEGPSRTDTTRTPPGEERSRDIPSPSPPCVGSSEHSLPSSWIPLRPPACMGAHGVGDGGAIKPLSSLCAGMTKGNE